MSYQEGEAELNRRVRWRDTLPEPPKMRAVWVMVDFVYGCFCGNVIIGRRIGNVMVICMIYERMM